MNDIREAMLHGLRPSRTFRFAATKYLQDHTHKKSIGDDAIQLKMLDPMIGDLDLRQVHMSTLQGFIAKRKADGVKIKTGKATRILPTLNQIAQPARLHTGTIHASTVESDQNSS